MGIEHQIQSSVAEAMQSLYGESVTTTSIQVSVTRKDQIGDYTVVVFPLLKASKKNPEQTGQELGRYLVDKLPLIASFEVIKGFLNLSLAQSYWAAQLNKAAEDESFGFVKADGKSPLVMIEYSSPNTNKPLHLGHIRNNLLGFSLSRLVAANGNRVVKTNIVNDRGIHICKSMLAWTKWGNGVTPESAGIKGDHLVGDFYVRFDKEYKSEQKQLVEKGMSKEEAEQASPLMAEARQMLLDWEAGNPEVTGIWKMMNQWVYEGFDVTYKALGVDFDKIYYESDTYSTGKEQVLEGLKKGVFYQRDDQSIWVDLTKDGLDEKLLLRSDGTSVYMTQDIGTAKMRFNDFPIDKMIYVVGNEQNYHFQVLSLVLDKLGFEWGKELVHFSYGMVELPEGKMKSREGTVVDADDLVADMINTAREMSRELGKLEGYSNEEAEAVYQTIALGALKYFMLKVDPKKNMTFNPKESIDFNGNTGPFIQYTYARIQSIMRKAAEGNVVVPDQISNLSSFENKEIQLLRLVEQFPVVVKDAGDVYSPAIIANFIYDLAKEYNQFYHELPIMFEEDAEKRATRLLISRVTATIIKNGMWILGINVPDRM